MLTTPAPIARRRGRTEDEMDIAYLTLTLGFFAASWGFIELCARS